MDPTNSNQFNQYSGFEDDDELLIGEVIEPDDFDRPEPPRRHGLKGIWDDTLALWIVVRDPRVGMTPKLIAAAVAIYLVSPIDLISDALPLIGIADDALIIPAGIKAALSNSPVAAVREARLKVATGQPAKQAFKAIAIVAVIWIALAALAIYGLWKLFT